MRTLPLFAFLGAIVVAGAEHAAAQSALSGEPIRVARTSARITIDGDLSDEGWRGATRVEKWYEINPGDNTEPKLKNVGYLAYDDRFFYAGFEFDDPTPGGIRAPLGDRDNVPGFTDYGGIILDTRNDGRSAQMFLAKDLVRLPAIKEVRGLPKSENFPNVEKSSESREPREP